MDLSIIIVSFNTKDVTLSCIKALQQNYKEEFDDQKFEIIVVDNASPDKSGEALAAVKEITFIQNPKNDGFSKANNIGIKKSIGKYVLFLNPDTVVPKETLLEMMKFMDNNQKVGASTCRVVLPNGEIDDSCHRGFPTPWNALCYFAGLEKIFPHSRLFAGYHMGWKDLSRDHKIDALAGSFMFVRRKAGENANWWDEDYFFYGEDIDFCYMLKQKGWDVYYVARPSVLHLKGVAGGIKKISKNITTANQDTRILVTKWRFKAMKIFYRKHYAQKYPFWLTTLVILAVNLRLWYNLRKINKS